MSTKVMPKMSTKVMPKVSEGTKMSVKFWGVRGSIPAPGAHTIKYGGNTSCVSIENEKEIIILDGGSGLRELGINLMGRIFSNGFHPLTLNLFFSHVHWDHIQGLPFFKPMFVKGNTIHMYGEKKVRTSLEETLKCQQQYPNFPISLEEISLNGSEINFTDLYAGSDVHIGSLIVSNTKLSHPDGVLCYKISGEKSIVYATDTEHRNVLDPRLIKIAKNADILIYDAQYTPEEYEGRTGIPKFDWGHSTFEQGCNTAKACNVKTLVLFHHDPEHKDLDIDEIEKRAKEMANGAFEVIAAKEGLELKI